MPPESNASSLLTPDILFNAHQKARILVVEDDPIQAEITLRLLQTAGLSPFLAENGEIACDLFQTQPFAMVLMDLRMPCMDGFQACSKIRSMPHGTLPIVAVTANHVTKQSGAFVQAGFDDLIKKPLDPAELYEKVRHYLNQTQDTGSSSPRLSIPPESIEYPTLDSVKGLARCRNDISKYKAFLATLLHDPAYTIDDLPDILQENRSDAVLRCHSAQGVAATLGAMKYHQTLKHLEEALEGHASDSKIAMWMEQVSLAREELLESVSAI